MTITETAKTLAEAYGTPEIALAEVLVQYRRTRRDGNQAEAQRLGELARAISEM